MRMQVRVGYNKKERNPCTGMWKDSKKDNQLCPNVDLALQGGALINEES